MPDTKPDLRFDPEGVCDACRSFESRCFIDWGERRKQLANILDKHCSKNSSWDCIVPVSGGKDSTYQVIRMIELGANPLCVTSSTCDLSEVGRRNIENIKKLGVDHIEFSPKPNVRAKLNRIGLMEVGDISWPEHVGIFTIPVSIAVKMNVPLIIWGENSQNEYGGPAASVESNVLTRRWLEEFGGLIGLRVSDFIGREGITSKDLIPYVYPTDEELQRVGVTGLFLGYYFPWDGYTNVLIAQANGFEAYPKVIEGSCVSYENIDNYQTGIHDYFKFLKFGFGRATDLACLHLRRGRLNRNDAVQIVQKNDGKFPWTYLGKSLSHILEKIDISLEEFISICDRFTTKSLFKTDSNGDLIKDRYGNLTKMTELL